LVTPTRINADLNWEPDTKPSPQKKNKNKIGSSFSKPLEFFSLPLSLSLSRSEKLQ
jgi:hypothetical protein